MNSLVNRSRKASATLLVLVFVAGLLVGGIATAYFTFMQINRLEDEISTIRGHISNLTGFQNITNQTITIYQNGTSLANIYNGAKDSVVLVRGTTSTGLVQGSGFVYNFSGILVVMTNNHVIQGTNSISVTFSNGNGYSAKVNGTDPYADLAVLSVDAPKVEFKPIDVVSSSTLRVGQPVIAIGNPYGLVGSMTTGVISALGRTITEENYTGGFAIANIIQTSAPINPGNSGGPLLNYDGKVVGITAAIVAESQGVGFAIPSNTIIREIWALITHGSYDSHSYLGVRGTDMDYETAQQLHVNVTYGWHVVEVVAGGPSADAGVQNDDIIVGMNETRITNGDELSSYLEEKTLPGDTLILDIIRGTQSPKIAVRLVARPPPSA
jgi:S1-C subfamily serine protease